MNDFKRPVKDFNYALVKDFVNKAFNIGVELSAYQNIKFSAEAVCKRILANEYQLLHKSHSSYFERVTYEAPYRKKSSSGEIAKTSLVFHKFTTEDKIEKDTQLFYISWPVHLHNRKGIYFDLDTGRIWLEFQDNTKNLFTYKLMTMDELINQLRKEYLSAIYFILRNRIPDTFKLNQKQMETLSSEDIRNYMTLSEIITYG